MKLGLQIQVRYHGDGNWFTDSKAKFGKIIKPDEQEFPSSIPNPIGRLYFHDEHDKELIARGATGGREYIRDWCLPRWNAVPAIKIWELWNEPDVANSVARYSLTEATQGALLEMRDLGLFARGIRAVIWNGSVGSPYSDPDDPYDLVRVISGMAPMFAMAIEYGCLGGYHGYWVPELTPLAQYHSLRHEVITQILVEHYDIVIPNGFWVIGEGGIDLGIRGGSWGGKGWKSCVSREEYWEQCKIYDEHISNDPTVLCWLPFVSGPNQDWIDFDFDATLRQWVVDYSRTHPWTDVQTEEEPMSDHTIRVKKPDGTIVVMDVEEHVKGVVPKEVYPSWPMEILRSQSIAARGYDLANIGKHATEGFDVCSTQHCQVYSDERSVRCSQAVEDTRGIVGVHKLTGAIVPTFFSASCGGQTLGNWADYLRSVNDCPCFWIGKEVNGHQNGLCQWGGKVYADEGRSFLQILDVYYDLDWQEDYGRGNILEVPPLPEPEPEPEPEPTPDTIESRLETLENDVRTLVVGMQNLNATVETLRDLMNMTKRTLHTFLDSVDWQTVEVLTRKE